MYSYAYAAKQIHVKSSFSIARSSVADGVENIKSAAILTGSTTMSVEKHNKVHVDFNDGTDGHFAKVSIQ